MVSPPYKEGSGHAFAVRFFPNPCLLTLLVNLLTHTVAGFRLSALLVFIGLGCRPVWLQPSCPRLADTAM